MADNPLTIAGAVTIIGGLLAFIRQLYEARLADLRQQLRDAEARGERYEALALRLLQATEEAAQVAHEAVARRNE